MTIYSSVINPKAAKGWVNHSSVLGSNSYDLNNLYSPDTAYAKSCVLDLASPKYNPHPTTIFDRSGNNNHGTITGATWSRLPSGLVVNSFDGTDDKITIANSVSKNTISTAFSFLVWLFTPSVDHTFRDFFSQLSGGGGIVQRLLINNTETLGGEYGFSDGVVTKYSTYTFPTGVWTCIGIAWDSTEQRINYYVNGALQSNPATGKTGTALTGTGAWQYGYYTLNDAWAGDSGLLTIFSNKKLIAPEMAGFFNSTRHLFGV